MGNMLRYGFDVEVWKLFRIAIIVFTTILTIILYFFLPNGHVLSSFLFAENFHVGNSSNTLHIKPSLDYMNLTSSNALDSSTTANDSKLSDPEDDIEVRDSGNKFEANGNAGESLAPDRNSLPVVVINGSSVMNRIKEHPVLMKEKTQVLVSSVNFTLRCLPGENIKIGCPKKTVMSLTEMNAKMLHSLVSSRWRPRWSSNADRELLKAKSLIINSPGDVKIDARLYAPLYRNISMFQRSYSLMEQSLKVYIYKEGEKPIFHQPVQRGIYASEGWFMKLLKTNKNFVTKNPKKAQLFYLPFSSRLLQETLYIPNSHSRMNLVEYLNNYVTLISSRYRFWNRTNGADHFLVACHDWAPSETRHIMERTIRSLCSADVAGGFKFGKDVSLPETYIKSARNPLRKIGGEPVSNRKILAFFAGNMHGYLRPLLLEYWQNKDKEDMKIFGQMAEGDYIQHMKSSKYCICARGYEVNSPRVVEAIFYECVPVMISDNFVPPFFESLNWEAFTVFVAEKDIPDLRKILVSIPEEKYLEMHRRVKMVQRHFLWHPKPLKYDAFHMILHSIWFTRVSQMSFR